ncbi:MAG: hypothetical protein ABS894_00795 [Aerococcus urinaeequi]
MRKKKSKVTQYKGFKIQERPCPDTGAELFSVFTKEEWDYGAGYRCAEWDATTMEEAHQFIDSY